MTCYNGVEFITYGQFGLQYNSDVKDVSVLHAQIDLCWVLTPGNKLHIVSPCLLNQ